MIELLNLDYLGEVKHGEVRTHLRRGEALQGGPPGNEATPVRGLEGTEFDRPSLRSLFFISSSGGSNPGRLAASLGVTPPNVTGIVDRLVEQGLVGRRESEQDRRVLLLQTTDKGEAILSDLRESRTNTMTEVLSRLDEAELQALLRG